MEWNNNKDSFGLWDRTGLWKTSGKFNLIFAKKKRIYHLCDSVVLVYYRVKIKEYKKKTKKQKKKKPTNQPNKQKNRKLSECPKWHGRETGETKDHLELFRALGCWDVFLWLRLQ